MQVALEGADEDAGGTTVLVLFKEAIYNDDNIEIERDNVSAWDDGPKVFVKAEKREHRSHIEVSKDRENKDTNCLTISLTEKIQTANSKDAFLYLGWVGTEDYSKPCELELKTMKGIIKAIFMDEDIREKTKDSKKTHYLSDMATFKCHYYNQEHKENDAKYSATLLNIYKHGEPFYTSKLGFLANWKNQADRFEACGYMKEIHEYAENTKMEDVEKAMNQTGIRGIIEKAYPVKGWLAISKMSLAEFIKKAFKDKQNVNQCSDLDVFYSQVIIKLPPIDNAIRAVSGDDKLLPSDYLLFKENDEKKYLHTCVDCSAINIKVRKKEREKKCKAYGCTWCKVQRKIKKGSHYRQQRKDHCEATKRFPQGCGAGYDSY